MVVRDYDSEGGVTLRFTRDSLGGVKAGAAPAQPEAMPAQPEAVPEGVQIVEETALLVHPNEVPVVKRRS